jgi:hypothetical protein
MGEINIGQNLLQQRTCGDCTKCCEGSLTGTVYSQPFYKGRPCHFVSIGKGCSIYNNRPDEPCKSFKCEWLTNSSIPEWMKPNLVNAIIIDKEIDGILYTFLAEAGELINPKVLTWLFIHCFNNRLNFAWQVDGIIHWIGSDEFSKKMEQDK